jgi:very-short-patch-repair endonuclease
MAKALSRYATVEGNKKAFARDMRKNPTEAEAALWNELRGSRLLGWKFRRQQVMYGYIADFYCEQANLCVELDGDVHQGLEQAAWDALRDAVVNVKGIRVVRFSNREVLGHMPAVLEKIGGMLGGICPSRPGPRSEKPDG